MPRRTRTAPAHGSARASAAGSPAAIRGPVRVPCDGRTEALVRVEKAQIELSHNDVVSAGGESPNLCDAGCADLA
jgi:hypothetical protein